MKTGRKIFLIALAAVLVLMGAAAASALSGDTILSGYYGIDRENALIGQIAPGTAESALLEKVVAQGELSLSDGIKTGSVLTAAADGTVTDSLTLVVQADINGDGGFSITDMLLVKSYLLQLQQLNAAQLQAGDVSRDGSITITDFLQMKSQILGLSQFSLGHLTGTQPAKTLILTPGDTLSFGTEQDAVQVVGSAVAWEKGIATAQQLGTALLVNGEQTCLITVCEQPLTLSLPEKALLIDPGASAPMGVILNYPVSADITYTCSDESIATVDENGTVTAVAEGTATVTATLAGGQSATREIRVLPFVKSITLSADSMKVKHSGGSKTLTAEVFPADAGEPLVWTSSDESIATVDANGVITGHADGYATITCTSLYGGVSASCRVKVCDLIQVALTFDDGPSTTYTPKVLDMLDKYGITCTFFMVGNRIGSAKKIVKRMYEAGHELGYHTWSHEFFFNMNKSQIEKDYEKFCNALMDACGQKPTVYRAPGGNITKLALQTLPMPHIMWSVDTRDWETRNTQKVKQAVLKGLKDGAIILVHDIHGTTYTGVLAALEEVFAKDMDVEFLTVTELLSRKGEAPQNGVTYYKN